MNFVVFILHRYVAFPLLRLFIRAIGPSRMDLVLRGSLLTPEFFHWAWSDIDLALILTDVYEREFPLKFLRGVKKAYPFLGEIEVYTFEQWDQLVALKEMARDSYPLARQVRKLGWQGPCPDGFFAKLKYQRGRRMNAAKMGLPESLITQQEAAQFLIQKLCTQDLTSYAQAHSYFHTYFKAMVLVLPHDQDQEGLKVSSGEAVWLSAWFPHDDTVSNAELVDRMGENARAQKNLLLEIDILEKCASQLGTLTQP